MLIFATKTASLVSIIAISSIPIPDPSYKRESYEINFQELDSLLAENPNSVEMIEVNPDHFVGTHDVKGLL